jgi:hypothetical protein
MDKTFIYRLFENLTVSAASRYPGQKFSKNRFFAKKRNFLLKIKYSKNKVISKNRLLVSAAGR